MEKTLLYDYQGIADVLSAYVKGAREGSSRAMALAFHPQATVRGQVDGELFDLTLPEFLAWVDGGSPASELTAHLSSLEIGIDAATARLQCRDWLGVDYTDLFTLLRRNGRWQVVSKVFDGRRRPSAPELHQ